MTRRSVLSLLFAVAIALPLSAADFRVISTADSGEGSLRQAILSANAAGPGTHRILIDFAAPTILYPASPLPEITASVTVRGATANQAQLHEINGSYAGPATGFVLRGTRSEIRGLSITNWQRHGIEVHANQAVISDSFIGTDRNGSTGKGNADRGILVMGARDVTMSSNVIVDNNVGAEIIGGTSNTIYLNRFGGRVKPELPVVGNRSDGLRVIDSTDNTIGAPPCSLFCTDGENIVQGNGGSGVVVSGNDNRLAYLIVGGDAAGERNAGHGVAVLSGANVSIRDSQITGNGGDGVRILAGNTRVVDSAVVHNTGIPIDLGGDGPTANDSGDPDDGANGLLNRPTISLAHSNGYTTTVEGTVDGTPDTDLQLQFFAGTGCVGGNGGGAPIGSATVRTDGFGQASFKHTFAFDRRGESVSADVLTASATSEFSPCVPVATSAEVNADLSVTGGPSTTHAKRGDEVTYTFTVRNDGPAAAGSVLFRSRVPQGARLLSVSTTRGTCEIGSFGVCFLEVVPANSTTTIQYVVAVVSGPALENTASVRAEVPSGDPAEPDPDSSDNQITMSVSVEGRGRLIRR